MRHNNEQLLDFSWRKGPLLMAVARAARAPQVSPCALCAHEAKGSEARPLERRPLHPRLRARRKEYAGQEHLGCSLDELGRSASKRAAKAADERVDMGALAWLTALARGRGGITPHMTHMASRERFEPGQRTARAKSDPLKAVCKLVAVGVRKLQPT